MAQPPTPAVLRHLERATAEHPLDRKLLVCSSMGEGRELLRALGRRGHSWLGWEITTPKRLAMELVAPSLAASGGSVADAYEEQATVDIALDAALAEPTFAPLRELGESPGFRQAVLNAVEALRLAGVGVDRLESAPAPSPGVRDLLARVLEGYEAGLAEADRVDTAAVLDRAVAMLGDTGARRPGVGADDGADPEVWRTYLVPGLSLRGATGRLAERLLERGARVLRSDPVAGPETPPVAWNPDPEAAPLSGLLAGEPLPPGSVDLSIFAASGPAEEIREVLRRIMDAGLRWDEVEIVATDPVVYGGALHVLAERLGIPVSYAVGLPVERTRAGRATAAYLRWVQGNYPADEIRRLLESGDLDLHDASPVALARRLRRLRIGWGHGRYLPAIDRALESLDASRPRRYESEDEFQERVERERLELGALRSLLAPILAATPRLDPRDPALEVSPADLARGLHAFLDHVSAADVPSATARDRLRTIAARVGASLTRPTRPAAAIALLRRHLEIRVPAPQREGAAPWVSAGGHLHLSDVEHGGHTARSATFVVGLDAERFPGAGLQDPLLLDVQRRALDAASLPTSSDRLAARQFSMAACLARLRGRVTLSYSAWDPTEAREAAPSAVVLQAFRSLTGRPHASFEDLRSDLGDAASPVPRTAAIDAADVWFRALEHDGLLRDGTTVVRAAFPGLDAGLAAGEARAGDLVTPYHGLIEPRPDRLDPRRNPELVLSASGLEDLGTCGLRYLYRYVLGVRAPEDPDADPDLWLNALDRGRLLHSVYESALRVARESDVATDDPAFMDLALEALDRGARRIARDVPPPGEAVRRRQMTELRADVRSFVRMVADDGPAWEALELKFGLQGEPPAPLPLRAGAVRVRGAIDRVDRRPDGLVVVDYKTGGSDRYGRHHGTFHGGRRLQNVVYSAIAESLLEEVVAGMEYHFPTRNGRNEVIRYRRSEVRRGLGLIDRLLDAVATGRFLPTESGDDCAFCDYAPICRHRLDTYPKHTPRADWASEHGLGAPAFRERREVRSWDETFLAELESDGPAD